MRYYASSEPGGEHVPGTKQAWSFGEFIMHEKNNHDIADYDGEGLMIVMLVMMMVVMMMMVMMMMLMMLMLMMMMMMIMMMRVIMIGMRGMVE